MNKCITNLEVWEHDVQFHFFVDIMFIYLTLKKEQIHTYEEDSLLLSCHFYTKEL